MHEDPGCDTISITGPGEKWKLNYKRYVVKGYSQYEAMNIRQEIVKRLRQRLAEMGYRNVQLRIDEVAQRENKKFFASKTGVTLYYLWLNISW